MAEVVAFQGIRYNPQVIGDMAAVVAPPYDVISPREQEGFYQRHPRNVIRLILGQTRPGDNEQDNFPLRAARTFEQWLADGVLVADTVPGFYLTTVDYVVDDQPFKRYGLIGRVRLEPFEKGIILPHERTFSKVKSERLLLRKACHANFSPIFGLFNESGPLLDRWAGITDHQHPDIDLVDGADHRQRLWRITDPSIVDELTRFFAQKRIYIADGHHRYETALNYRQWVRETTPDFTADHPANFVMMSLSSMEDPGMTILPAHRLIKKVPERVVTELLRKLPEVFDMLAIGLEGGIDAAVERFNVSLGGQAHQHAIGLYLQSPATLLVMVLKEGVMARLFSAELQEALRDLDVSVLTHLIMMHLMGFDQAFMDDATRITYRTSNLAAVQAVNQGEADMAFILNPTRIEQVQRVAENGLIMPRKSTYFYPKVISGLVFNRLR
ncbi:MAG: DUF1015 domain-containing protein [Desulfatitalea sp.]|nr:DUF1015 domain-containing protein [Desulfatitalea sp.]